MRILAVAPLVLVLLLPFLLGEQCTLESVEQDAGRGLVPESDVGARALEYLEFATAKPFSRSITNAIAHMTRERVDPGYTAPVGVLTAEMLEPTRQKLRTLEDTRDFDGMTLMALILGYEDHPMGTPAAWDSIREAMLSFKYWWLDPTPPVPDPDDPERDWDNSFYWTENHQIIYFALEYLAGQHFPDECFWIAGFERSVDCTGPGELTGQQHRDRVRARILRWLDERSRIGFVEFHSNVYYEKDAEALILRIEYADDPEIRTRAASMLDVLLIDLAVHTRQGVFGVTHGRSEMKDKFRGPAEDTYELAKLLFDQQGTLEYQSTGDRSLVLFAGAERYRLPQVIFRAAHDPGPFADRSRMSIPVPETLPVSDEGLVLPPGTPPGRSYEINEDNFEFWFGLGAWTAWQVVPITVVFADEYNLWSTDLLRPFLPLRDLLGYPVPNLFAGQLIAQGIAPLATFGLLEEANTYTYRTPDWVFSTAQDFRPGMNGAEYHAWQATFDSEALVFTQHAGMARQPPVEWIGRTEGEPGYWTGSASMPRGAQHENVGVYIYSPAYEDGGFIGFFDYELLTHAYFPQDRFDEVTQRGPWTFGRRGDGYVALYSFRDTQWESYTPEELAPLADASGLPVTRSFDLVAPGFADNVWIVELGRAADWSRFNAFVDAVAAATLTVAPRPSGIQDFEVFDVAYASPSQGLVTFGWEAPFVVNGETIALDNHPRMSNPWVHSDWGDRAMIIQDGGTGVVLDFEAGTRHVYGPLGAATSPLGD